MSVMKKIFLLLTVTAVTVQVNGMNRKRGNSLFVQRISEEDYDKRRTQSVNIGDPDLFSENSFENFDEEVCSLDPEDYKDDHEKIIPKFSINITTETTRPRRNTISGYPKYKR